MSFEVFDELFELVALLGRHFRRVGCHVVCECGVVFKLSRTYCLYGKNNVYKTPHVRTLMDFTARREKAIQDVKKKLRETLSPDRVLIHAWRTTQHEQAINWWLATVLPHMESKQAKQEVAKNQAKAWNPEGIGANMDEEGWQLLQSVCKDKKIDLEELAAQVAPNTTALLGAEKASELISAAGSLTALSRLTQRDCQALGNESGQFGNKNKKSILEEHEFATSDRALRILSSRTVLAARIDANNGEFKGDRLRQEVLYAQ